MKQAQRPRLRRTAAAARREIVAVLDNIRSVQNVASIFRTADGAGVSKLFLCGVTPTPLDRFGRFDPRFEKVSLGAERTVPWEKAVSTLRLVRRLKRAGYLVFAVEQDPDSVPLRRFRLPARGKFAFVFGSEVEGVPPLVLKEADKIVEIPMRGSLVCEISHPKHAPRGVAKESLNVSVAFGVVMYGVQ